MADLVTTLALELKVALARITALEVQLAGDHAARHQALERDVATLLRRVDGLAAANARLAAGLDDRA
jgi:hypothetical protein